MKKTFNRLLAATVAIPVALGQVLAISANAAEAPAALKVTADKLLKVEPATGFPETVSADADTITYTVESDWNTTLAKQLNTETSNKTVTVDAKKFVAGINSANYYVELLKKAVNASENPTATVRMAWLPFPVLLISVLQQTSWLKSWTLWAAMKISLWILPF